MLWGLGVGYVISGMYVGWNLGLNEGGTLGMAIATFFIIIMYVAFSFSYSELACAIPKAGGAFDYAQRTLGRHVAFIAGIAQVIEFVFAPPAIAFGIGAYLNLLIPEISILNFAIGSYILFTAINIYGVKFAATFELVVTLISLLGIVLFLYVTIPHFQFSNLEKNAYPQGWTGSFAAIPFAIWFFLGIEGVANVAEETVNPQKDIVRGFGSAILTLVVACILTFIFAVGVGGWETIVFNQVTGETSDSPLPLALNAVIGNTSLVYRVVVSVGLFGLIASFHGLLLAAGRATFELGRVGYAPPFLGKIHKRFQTPHIALIVNMLVGIAALLTGKTGDIITLSVFGALILYILSMIAVLVFRKKEKDAPRPFKVPFFPLTPLVALAIALFSFLAMLYYHWPLALVFFGLLLLSFIAFKIFVKLTPTGGGDHTA